MFLSSFICVTGCLDLRDLNLRDLDLVYSREEVRRSTMTYSLEVHDDALPKVRRTLRSRPRYGELALVFSRVGTMT